MKFYFGPKTQQTRKPIQKIKIYLYFFIEFFARQCLKLLSLYVTKNK